VGPDVAVFDVSDVASSVRQALCPRCVGRLRADALVIVEQVDDDEDDALVFADSMGSA
jgi:hypothetical protein